VSGGTGCGEDGSGGSEYGGDSNKGFRAGVCVVVVW